MVYSFTCILAFFVDDDWKLVECIVNFCHLESKDHEGVNAAKAFIQGAQEHSALSKMSDFIYF